MATALGCSANCRYVRNPIKLSGGCSPERYLMRQRYLRSYPLMTKRKWTAGKVAERTKKWLKKKWRKYRRFGDDDDDEEIKQTWRLGWDDKAKLNRAGSSYVRACLKLLLVCVAKVDVRMENPEPAGL